MRNIFLFLSLGFCAAGQAVDLAALFNEARPYMDSLISFATEYDAKWYAQSRMVPTRADDMRKVLADLAEVEKLMAGKYRGATAVRGATPNEIRVHPEAWAAIAGARMQIARRIAEGVAGDTAKKEIQIIEDRTRRLAATEGYSAGKFGLNLLLGKKEAARAEALGSILPLLEAAGVKDGGSGLAGFDAACDQLVKEIQALAPSLVAKNTNPDATVETRIRAGWAKNYPDRKIVRMGFSKADWAVKKNALGQPVSRSKQGSIVYRIPGISLLVEETLIVIEDYAGGNYKNRPVAQDAAVRLVTK